ncbi:MAG: SpoIIE family protein phosphatase [Candidatus Acidiferrum sp.]
MQLLLTVEKRHSVGIQQAEWLQQVERVLETLNEGVIVSDDLSRILSVNSRFEEMTGIPRKEIIGEEASHFYSPREADLIAKQKERGMRQGHNRFEFVLPKKGGSRLPVIISSRVMHSPDGGQFGVITFTDISEQKRAEEQLRKANKQLEERQKEVEDDLALAARVQETIAPKCLTWGGVSVEAYFQAVRTIGGDFGLAMPYGEDHLNLLVGDVSGHGIGSALVANRIYTEIVTQFRAAKPLGDMLQHMNRFVMENMGGSGLFFTAALARIDLAGRRILFAGGGHPPVMLVTPGQEPRLLESRSMVLGALAEAVSPEPTLDVSLQQGDRIVLYTDGITDVFNSRDVMLGVAGIREFVREAALLPFSEMKQGILERVEAWREGPPSDDVSLMLVEVD